MPTIFNEKGWRFFFFSNEGNPREPVHVHVTGGGGAAKFWVDPLRYDSSQGYSAKQLRDIEAIIACRVDDIKEAWNVHFS